MSILDYIFISIVAMVYYSPVSNKQKWKTMFTIAMLGVMFDAWKRFT